MAQEKNKKHRVNVVYSTNPDFNYNYEEEQNQATLPPDKQNLRVWLETKHRGGKAATLVTGFVGTITDLEALGKLLKTKCGVGGSVKDGEIIIQGDHKLRVAELLKSMGYTKTKPV